MQDIVLALEFQGIQKELSMLQPMFSTIAYLYLENFTVVAMYARYNTRVGISGHPKRIYYASGKKVNLFDFCRD